MDVQSYSFKSAESNQTFTSEENAIRRRKRKSNHQVKILKGEYTSGTLWSKEKIEKMSKITGLSEAQVIFVYSGL